MEDIKVWLKLFTDKMRARFPDNISCLGIQGSYARGEAGPDSDIDLVVVFHKLSFDVLQQYKKLLGEIGKGMKLCGFVCDRQILSEWNDGELLQLYFDTLPLYGNLTFISKKINRQAALKLVQQNSNNIYHGCCHNYLFDRDWQLLRNQYKAAVFTVQAKYYYSHDTYITSHRELQQSADADDKEILSIAAMFKNNCQKKPELLEEYSSKLLAWSCKNIIEFSKGQ